jgi:HD-GYP domain-containing protein (c-di-GMP phosphodiesterase class II)
MDLVGLVAEARDRRPQPMTGKERVFIGGWALVALTATGLLSVVIQHDRPARPAVIALLIVAYAIARQVTFEVGTGVNDASVLVYVPVLFLAPLHLVPLVVAAGHLLGHVPDFALRRRHPDRWMISIVATSYSLGAALIIGLLAPGAPQIRHALVYAAAVSAELVIDGASAAIHQAVMVGEPVRNTVRQFAWTARVDLALTPLGYALAAAAWKSPLVVATVIPLFWVIRSFSREREERHTAMIELNQAYRGTVLVLSDVVEADDHYTGAHCRSVVELATAVGRQLALPMQALQELEMVALMHDVGKITIPHEILHKPAKLTEDEFEVMKQHTIQGQALLDRVGGKLAHVGEMVRSCHERWDGRGYPDGLIGDQIPLAARIVFCCDAYSAMTTDRPYRKALPVDVAVKELTDNAGTQFDSRVVDALVRVIAAEELSETSDYAEAVRTLLVSSSSGEIGAPA